MDIKLFIVYSSPAGSTRRVAETIRDGFRRQQMDSESVDLGAEKDASRIIKQIQAAGRRACLFIGSPVYGDVAVPPVIQFIEALPNIAGAMAVPFATWGQACSGVALWQMGRLLLEKGFKILAAAKVMAVHSLMWQTADPAGQGHPDQADLAEIDDLVAVLGSRFKSADISSLALETLDYQPHERADQMKKKIAQSRQITPKKVRTEACTQCGVCEAECPAGAISIDPYPQFDQSCFDCFNCIRLCPEDAIEPAMDMQKIIAYIRQRVSDINEQPPTQIFI
jgi:ferredoxin/flavodoxin